MSCDQKIIEAVEKPVEHGPNHGISPLKRPLSSYDLRETGPCSKRSASETVFKIISATYGPSEGRRLVSGERSNDLWCIPFTRDVAPFLRALLMIRRASTRHNVSEINDTLVESDTEDFSDLVRITGRRRHAIPLMDGKQMNSVFGDPCPGTSKRLHIHYVTYEIDSTASSALEVHRVSFTEHDRVVLRHRVRYYQDDANLKNAVAAVAKQMEQLQTSEEDSTTLQNARQMGRAQSIADFSESLSRNKPLLAVQDTVQMIPTKKWRLRSAISEIALPIILPFLEIPERVQCKEVCRVWRNVIRYWGVAKTIDVDDDATFPHFNRPILRGLLAHSHHSLQSLFLSEYRELTKDDIHPAIPHLRKLRCLDISRCNNLDDSTLILLAEHVSSTLEVFYLKGLRNVTDRGLVAIARSCAQLQVLEISALSITDECAITIGENLTKLRALYMRDNYQLSNRSVDVITEKCTLLTELTLWGCMRLKHLSFDSLGQDLGYGNLVLLNLWGCHSLLDETSNALRAMKNLRSLIVSECHKLTSTFLLGVAEHVPQLNHLHLRYCKRVNDIGINAIANSLKFLFSLDMSFCSRVTSASILDLLEVRQDSLTELRLQNCRHLDIARDPERRDDRPGNNVVGNGQVGRLILNVFRSQGTLSHLRMLDVRGCGGFQSDGYASDDPFVDGMTALKFKQSIPGFFQRPSRSNPRIICNLIDQDSPDYGVEL